MLSLRDGSFFSGSHLTLGDIVELTYLWCKGTTISNTVHETGHSSRTIVDWFNFHQDVCAQYIRLLFLFCRCGWGYLATASFVSLQNSFVNIISFYPLQRPIQQ